LVYLLCNILQKKTFLPSAPYVILCLRSSHYLPTLFALFVANIRSFCRRCSELLPSVFVNGGGRCSETLVVDVRKWW
ncbi:MAG: hypothetical protein IJ269_05675, partial [Bacteroidales bacterium]|nr:hypothetical protein [Bacteroidales bacterium]